MDGHDNKGTSSEVEVVSGEASQVSQVDQAPGVVPGEVPITTEPVAVQENNIEIVVLEEVPAAPELPVAVESVPTAPEPALAAPEPAFVETPQEINKKTEIINEKVSDVPAEPVAVQESPKAVAPEEAKEPVTEAPRDDKSEIKNEVIAEQPVGAEQDTQKRDPMEIARGLDHDVLEAAFRLLAQERSAKLLDAKKKSDKKKVDENSDRVERFVAQYKKGVRRTTIADKLNMSPSKVTDYLQRLIASGRVRGEGKTNDRRFYIS